jgi:DtxR family transcriptional regulator, Mn-dependent transcriptional regulator
VKERQEEILEAIWKTSEIGQYSIEAIKKKCAIEMAESDLSELETLGMISLTEDRVVFSKDGKTIAERVVRRHRLAESLLSSVLSLRDSKMEEIACQVEHTLLPEVEEAICTLLGHPEVCPDGKPIPPGSCCERHLTKVGTIVSPMTDLKPGESGKISYIKPASHSQLHQLLSFGLNPGVVVRMHRTTPALCIKFAHTQLAMDDEIAKNIFVLRIPENNGS